MINLKDIKKNFRSIRLNTLKAKTLSTLQYLLLQTERIRRKYINVYVNPMYSGEHKKVLEAEYEQTIEKIKNRIKRLK